MFKNIIYKPAVSSFKTERTFIPAISAALTIASLSY